MLTKLRVLPVEQINVSAVHVAYIRVFSGLRSACYTKTCNVQHVATLYSKGIWLMILN